MKKIIVYTAVFLSCVTGYTLQVTRVLAQQITLSISPPLLELFIKPGKSVLIAYSIENRGDPAILQAKVLPFEPLGNEGQIKIKEQFEGPVRFNLDNSNIELEKPFFLKTKDREQLLLRIRLPEGTPEGDYYYTLLVETLPPQGEEGSTASLAKATIGSNILITVTESGQVDISGKVALFDLLSPYQFKIFGRTFKLFESTDKVPVVLILENKGRNLIKPQGEITLVGNFGEKATFDILPQNILSQSQRLVLATPSAQIDYPKPISLILSGFFIGQYRLSTAINFGEGTAKVFAATTFYALPFKFAIGVLVVIILVVIISKRLRS